MKISTLLLATLFAFAMSACSSTGPAGPQGNTGTPGAPGATGATGGTVAPSGTVVVVPAK